MRTTFDHLFRCLSIWLAPVLCFTAEEAWLARNEEPHASIHLQSFPEIPPSWQNPVLGEKFTQTRAARKAMTGALELARAEGKIGSSLQAHLKVYDPRQCLSEDINWNELAITSKLEILADSIPQNALIPDGFPEIGIIVQIAEGEKCQRCWKVLKEVGTDLQHPDLCNRCCTVLGTPDLTLLQETEVK